MAGTIKRAYELAPGCITIDELKARLKREGFENVEAHLQGASIKKDLTKLLKARREDGSVAS